MINEKIYHKSRDALNLLLNTPGDRFDVQINNHPVARAGWMTTPDNRHQLYLTTLDNAGKENSVKLMGECTHIDQKGLDLVAAEMWKKLDAVANVGKVEIINRKNQKSKINIEWALSVHY